MAFHSTRHDLPGLARLFPLHPLALPPEEHPRTSADDSGVGDGAKGCWTTFYCGDAGYRIDNDENACAYTAEVGNDVITLHKLGKVIPKDKAVIIVGEDNSISMTRDDVSAAEYSVKNDLHGVDVPTARTTLTSDDTKTLYMLSNKNNHFGFHKYGGNNVPARKAYFTVSSSANAPEHLGFDGETTGIISNTDFTDSTNMDGVWYSLDGRKLQGMPTQKGIYI